MTSSSPLPASGAKHLQIDVWSDVACPWCYIGKSRLEKAIASSDHAGSITVFPHSFELDPAASREPIPTLELLSGKLRLPQEQVERMEDQMIALATAEGLEYTPHRVNANSFDAHRVLHLAATYGLAGQLLGVLQRELFSGRANVYDPVFLVAAATGLGIPGERVEEVLAGDEFEEEVRQDEHAARRLGITGVPFAVLAGRYAIPGAASVEGYAQAIEQAWDNA
ncbi:MAG TPA: DsbA family oxidoreductase [Streptosporangiaceae bacterium]|nr:DsbA family oxidoreductase [Streptosporangiaceae bacterium]